MATAILALKDRSQVRQVSLSGLWNVWTGQYGAQSVALGAALLLGASIAATAESSGLNMLRRLRSMSAAAVAQRCQWVAGASAVVLVATRFASQLAVSELTCRLDHLPLGLGPFGARQLRFLVADLVATVLASQVGVGIGLLVRRPAAAVAVAAPIALAGFDQLALFFLNYQRAGLVASYLPGGLAVTLVEGTAGLSARGIASSSSVRSPWIGAAGLVGLAVVLVGVATLRPHDRIEDPRPAGSARPLAALAAAVLVGLFLPVVFAGGVPWRYRTEWLSERHDHTSSIDVVERFVAAVHGHADRRALVLVVDPTGGADPSTAEVFAPLRDDGAVRVGPDSAMDGPDTVPVRVGSGSGRVGYLFFMERRGGRWLIRQVQASPAGGADAH